MILKSDPRLSFRFSFFAVMAIAVTVFMGKSGDSSLQAMDSAYHARIALETTSRGLSPALPMESQEWEATLKPGESPRPGFNDQPFTLLYLNGWVMRALGPDAWSARLLPTTFSVACVAATIWLGTLLYSGPVGLAAGLILTFTREFIRFGARFQLDPAMIFFILLSFILWWKKKPLWAGVLAGLGLWMKTPVALLLFPSVLLANVLTGTLSFKLVWNLFVSTLIAVLIGSGVWSLTGALGGFELVKDYWSRQVLGTAMNGRGVQHTTEYFMWWDVLRRTYQPWLLLLFGSLFYVTKSRGWKRPEVAFTLAPILVVIAVISMIRFKYSHYYLPMFPFIAIFALDPLKDWLVKRQVGFSKFLLGAGMLVPTLIVAFPIQICPEAFPSLRRFNPIIQSYGKCRDKVLFIDGFQPYGSGQEYLAEVQFYTHRKVISAHCADAMAKTLEFNPEWIIVSGANFESCLTAGARSRYPVTYQFGNQRLLSRVIEPDQALNLTPLVRELKAVVDCEPAPLPQDIFYRYE